MSHGWSVVKMSSQQFDPNKMKPTELRVQWGALQKELEYKEKAFIQRGEELERAYDQLKQRESELQQKTADLIELRVKLEAKTVELGQRKKPLIKIIAIIVSLLFGVTNVLFNLANNMIGAKPPDPNGNVLIAIAATIYFACAVITIFVLGGGN